VRKNREVAVFVYRGDQFLLTRRSHDGKWNVVAGQVEDGESFAAAAARELAEEAQLDSPIVDLDFQRSYEVEAQFRSLYAPGEYTVTIAAFAAEAPAGWEPVLNHEHNDYRWCSLADALALLYWPEMKEALRALAPRIGIAR
jgi:8-oxo-dGTP pyrophosphatase MutT (NUDIX family)